MSQAGYTVFFWLSGKDFRAIVVLKVSVKSWAEFLKCFAYTFVLVEPIAYIHHHGTVKVYTIMCQASLHSTLGWMEACELFSQAPSKEFHRRNLPRDFQPNAPPMFASEASIQGNHPTQLC